MLPLPGQDLGQSSTAVSCSRLPAPLQTRGSASYSVRKVIVLVGAGVGRGRDGSQCLGARNEDQKSEQTAQEPQQRAPPGVDPAMELVAEVLLLRFLFSFFLPF